MPNVSLLSVVSIWKTLTPLLRSTSPMRQLRAVELALVAVHEAARLPHGLHVVVVPERAVGGEAGGGGLPPAVHRDEVDVDVDEEVALGGPLVDLHLLAVVGLAEVGMPSGSSASWL